MGEHKRKKAAAKTAAASKRQRKQRPLQARPAMDLQPYGPAPIPASAKLAVSDPPNAWILADESSALWRRNFKTGAVLILLPVVAAYAALIESTRYQHISVMTVWNLVFLALSLIWLLVNSGPIFYFCVQASNDKRPSIRQCYRHGLRFLPRLFGLFLLTTLLCAAGGLLFIIPGLIVFRRYYLAPYYMVEHNLGIRAAMASSARDSKPFAAYIWGVAVMAILVFPIATSFLSRIFPPIGGALAAVASSLYLFGPALRYRDIASRADKLANLLADGDKT